MKKIKIIGSWDQGDFLDRLNKHLAAGWILHGIPFAKENGEEIWNQQAVAKDFDGPFAWEHEL